MEPRVTVNNTAVENRAWATVAIVAAAGALVSLDTMVNIAFPAITESFGIAISEIQWLVTTYVLTFASLLLAAGGLSDAFGHRRVLAVGLVLTALGVGLCGVANEYGWFLVARVVQGAGAALVMGSSPALVTLAVPEYDRNRALGFFQMGAAIGLAIGPALGGILLEWTSWRSVYLVRVPAALLVLVFVARILPTASDGDGRRLRDSGETLDLQGAVLVGVGLAAGLLALSRAGTSGWSSPVVLIGLLAAAVLLCTWFAVERRASNPVIDLSLLRSTPFTVANVLNVVANGTMFAIWLLTPYYLVTVRGLSTIAGGVMLGIAPFATAVAAPIAGRLLSSLSTGRLSSIGLTLEAAGLVAVAFTGADTPLLLVAGAFALVGVGLGLFTVPNMLFVMGSIPRDRQGVAGALSQMMRMVGIVTGVAGATLLFDARRSAHVADLAVPAEDPTAFVAAYRDTFAVVAVLCAVAIGVSLLRPAREHALAP
jgi:EmrB/QacA subfamily drug resistance transporter